MALRAIALVVALLIADVGCRKSERVAHNGGTAAISGRLVSVVRGRRPHSEKMGGEGKPDVCRGKKGESMGTGKAKGPRRGSHLSLRNSEEGKPSNSSVIRRGGVLEVVVKGGAGKKHKKNRVCADKGCIRQPSFGEQGQSRPSVCALHRLPGMVDLRNKKCQHAEGCLRWPFFGDPSGGKRKQFCNLHRQEHHIDMTRKRCYKAGCTRWPSFGEAGGVAQYCKEHKEAGHIDVKHKRCFAPGCDRQPIYGHAQEGVPLMCSEHREEEQVDVKHQRWRPQNGRVTSVRRVESGFLYKDKLEWGGLQAASVVVADPLEC